jgi:phosphohistidine phosphatase
VRVHLFRHGIAIDPSDAVSQGLACPTDPERFLTDKGKDRARAAARGLRVLGITPEIVVTSPYVRARQTAAIVREELGVGEETVTDLLVPMAAPSLVAELLRGRGEQDLLCVGHAPHLDLLVAYLVGADDPITSLKKAGCASLEIRHGRPGAGTATLVGVYTSSALRKLAGERDPGSTMA